MWEVYHLKANLHSLFIFFHNYSITEEANKHVLIPKCDIMTSHLASYINFDCCHEDNNRSPLASLLLS